MTDQGSATVSTAQRYDVARPRLPEDLVALLAQLAGRDRPDVVDLGAGTGHSSLLWVGSARTITAVEPADNMRAVLLRKTAELPVTVLARPAQETGLPDNCADVVTACHSVQWFDPDVMLPEIARILRPGGVFALISASFPPCIHPDVDIAYERFITSVAAAKKGTGDKRPNARAALNESALFPHVRRFRLHSKETGDIERLTDLAHTLNGTSVLLRDGHSPAALGLDALAEAARRHVGTTAHWWWFFDVSIGVTLPLERGHSR